MCWSSVTCSRLVSYAHWSLGRGKALMFRDFLQLKSSAEPVTVAVKCTVWNLSLANIQAFWFFFSFGEHLCVSWRWTQRAVAGEKLCCLFPAVLISAICSTPVGDLSQRDVNSALMKSALAAFGFTQTFCKSVPGKFSFFFFSYPLPFSVKVFSPGTNVSATQIFITPCWVCEISCCKVWSLVQSSVKPRKKKSLSSTGFNPTFITPGLVGQTSQSLAIPKNYLSVLPVAVQGTLSLIFF